MRKCHELLPGAVCTVGHRWDGMKRKAGFELRNCFFVVAATAHEIPEVCKRETHIAGHGGILVMPVVRIKQCSAPGSLDTSLSYAAWRSLCSSRASIGV